MIEFQGVTKRFGGRRRAAGVLALRDVSLTISTGSVTGVVGPNGAGKSTFFALLLGFLRPTAGSAMVAGMAPRDYTRKHGAGYLPERFSLPPDWSVRSALEGLADLERIPEAQARAGETLARLGLVEHADKAVSALSRGLLQRLGLAQALLARRQLIVLDEPTEGLDPVWRVRFRELIADLRSEDRTLLIASHDLTEIERLVDRVIVMDDGAIRESLAIDHASTERRRYRIELQSSVAGAAQLLGLSKSETEKVFTVELADARELSARLAALLDLGAIVESVTPADGLEERVRAALQPEPKA
ncbi:MAG: ABC transporter ATP-binding protein [Gemmatimonadota bacterium]